MQVKRAGQEDLGRWDTFVEGMREATFFHRAGWKRVIEKAFGHRTYYLYAEKDGVLAGVIPLAHVRSRIFDNALISLPFCVYGGIVAVSREARCALEEAAIELARRLRVDYLECRNIEARRDDWERKSLYVTFRKEIAADPEENLRAVPRKQRAMIRKGMQAGLTSIVDDTVDRLYDIYAESVRNLGTPVFSKRYFELIQQEFGDSCNVITVISDTRPINSVMSFYFRDEVLPFYGGGTLESRRLAGNDYLYWELMRRAAEKGARIFDFGRSKRDSGSYHFKKHWGFEPQPLHYEYFLVKRQQMPDLSPANPKFRLMIAAWKRLPLPLARRLGPIIARNLG